MPAPFPGERGLPGVLTGCHSSLERSGLVTLRVHGLFAPSEVASPENIAGLTERLRAQLPKHLSTPESVLLHKAPMPKPDRDVRQRQYRRDPSARLQRLTGVADVKLPWQAAMAYYTATDHNPVGAILAPSGLPAPCRILFRPQGQQAAAVARTVYIECSLFEGATPATSFCLLQLLTAFSVAMEKELPPGASFEQWRADFEGLLPEECVLMEPPHLLRFLDLENVHKESAAMGYVTAELWCSATLQDISSLIEPVVVFHPTGHALMRFSLSKPDADRRAFTWQALTSNPLDVESLKEWRLNALQFEGTLEGDPPHTHLPRGSKLPSGLRRVTTC
jgi:hypothetical protein